MADTIPELETRDDIFPYILWVWIDISINISIEKHEAKVIKTGSECEKAYTARGAPILCYTM